MQPLTPEILREEAAEFAHVESKYDEPSLYGVTDGKRVGTYLEHKFRSYLEANYSFEKGNSASGIDFSKPEYRHEGHEHQAAAVLLPFQICTSENLWAWVWVAGLRV